MAGVDPRPAVLVGLDLGTTSAKAVAYDARARAWGSAAVDYPLAAPAPGHAEQDPDRVVAAALEALSGAAGQAAGRGARVTGVTLSAAMHSLVGLDASARPVTPLLTYADSRAAPQADRLRADPDNAALLGRSGTPLHAMAPLAKLQWFREHRPDVWTRTARWGSAKEYLLARLFGEFVVDHSVASATGLFDLRARDWNAGALTLVGLDAGRLSRPVPTDHVLRGLEPATAERLGLDPATPFVVGAADGCLANLGAGAIGPGVAVCTIGTSGAVRVATTTPDTDPQGQLFTYALTGDRWVVGGAISNGGLALRWLRDELLADVAAAAAGAGDDPYERLIALAAASPPGAGGLLCLPYLTGERAPDPDARARGVLFGLTLRHGRAHVVRAALEGVAFGLRTVAEALEALGMRPAEFRATGGFTRSPLWLQIVADVLGRDLAVPEPGEATCLGAALLGMVALGLVDSVDAAAGLVRIDRVVRPNDHAARAYDPLFALFTGLHEQLQEGFAALAVLDSPGDRSG